MDWLQRTFSNVRLAQPGTERDLALRESIVAYRQNMEAIIPEFEDTRLISHHDLSVVAAYEEFCHRFEATDDNYIDFEVSIQEAFMDILDSNWAKVEEFCRESLNVAESKTLNVDGQDDGGREAESQDYWNLMKQIRSEYALAIGDSLHSKMNHIRLEYLDDRQDVDFDVCIDQWKKQNQKLSEATNSIEETVSDDNKPPGVELDTNCNEDSNPLVTEDDSTSTLNQASPGLSEEMFCQQLRLQMTWGRLLIFWKYWIDCRRETIELLREISEFLKDEQNGERSSLILNDVLYQRQSHVVDSADNDLDCEVHDFPNISVRFANVVNKDIRCYKVLLRKLQDFLELVRRDDYLSTFQVDPSDIFLSISTFQQDVTVKHDRESLGLKTSELILEREDRDANEGTSWLLECTSRPLVHLRELFGKLEQEGRLDPGGLAVIVRSLEKEDREMEEMFVESIQSFLNVSSTVNGAFDRLRHDIQEWLPKRDETITKLKEITRQLNKTTRDVTISQTVGSSVGIVGGLVAIGGLVLSPFTLGLSLIPAAVAGGVIGGAGALTAIGSTLAEIIIDKNLVDQATACLEEDKILTEALVEQIRQFNEASSLLLRYIPQDELESFISVATYERSSANPGLTPTPEDIGPRLGITVSRLVTVGGKAIAMPVTKMVIAGTVAASRMVALAVSHSIVVIGIGLDIANIVLAAVKLGKGAKSENATKLEGAIADLEKGKREIKEIYLDSEEDCDSVK